MLEKPVDNRVLEVGVSQTTVSVMIRHLSRIVYSKTVGGETLQSFIYKFPGNFWCMLKSVKFSTRAGFHSVFMVKLIVREII